MIEQFANGIVAWVALLLMLYIVAVLGLYIVAVLWTYIGAAYDALKRVTRLRTVALYVVLAPLVFWVIYETGGMVMYFQEKL